MFITVTNTDNIKTTLNTEHIVSIKPTMSNPGEYWVCLSTEECECIGEKSYNYLIGLIREDINGWRPQTLDDLF